MSVSVEEPWKYFTGRLKCPSSCSNAEQQEVPEFESFAMAGPLPRSASTANLKCASVDMMVVENTWAHNTNRYHVKNNTLIIRRGQEFKITLNFNQPIMPSDEFQIEFYIGKNYNTANGTKTIISFDGTSSQSGSWMGKKIEENGKTCVVGITPAPNAIIGKYQMNVAIIGNSGISRTPSMKLYVLFNAWGPDDDVFMSNELDKQEYLMNEKGCLYQDDSGSGKLWLFGQFEDGVLDACLQILDDSQMPIASRGNAFKISRISSAMMNFQRGRGVLVGNWSKDFSLGTEPDFWIGSVQILLEYVKHGPVKYAQCWVFAGVYNTFLRCLGIPARVITNFNSAHDSNGKIVTDLIFNVNGSRIELNESLSRDSVWNYHCWNEVYMSRPDLHGEYKLSGWQVVDATPQETSDGYFRCGPCPVKAVKEGMLSYQFDTKFVFAEVNSTLKMHKIDPRTGKTELFKVDTEYIGRKIVTKSIGENNFEPAEITLTYKYPKGSREDIEIMQRLDATYKTLGDLQEDEGREGSVAMTLERPVDLVKRGDSFKVAVVFKNPSSEKRTLQCHLVCSVVYYTNIHKDSVKEESFDITLNPKETSKFWVEVRAEEYLLKLNFQSHLRFMVTAKIKENDQHLMAMQTVHLEAHDFVFSMSGPTKVNQVTFVTVQFINTFSFALMDVKMALTGPRLMSHKEKSFSIIEPGATISWTESCLPTASGDNMLYAVLVCPNLGSVRGNWIISVQP